MKNKMLAFILLVIFLISGCASNYRGPYATTKLVTKNDLEKQIDTYNKMINNDKTPLLKQVQAKSDIKYFKMLLSCYENYESVIRNIDGKKYVITSENINKFIKTKKFEKDLLLIEPNRTIWVSIFLGNLARYFDSLGFKISSDPNLKTENIAI